MGEFNLNVQDGANKNITSNNVVYDSDSDLLKSFNAPLVDADVTNKEYADGYLFGFEGSVGAATGDFPTWDTVTTQWLNKNTNDRIFNALKISGYEVENTAPGNRQALIFNDIDSLYHPSAIVNSVDTTGVGASLIAGGTTGLCTIKGIQSSDDSVDVGVSLTDLDLKVPFIELDNTASGTSKYFLTNPGIAAIGGDPYLFLGLNTLTPSAITFTSDANNVYVNALNSSIVSQYTMTTGSISANTSETTLRSFTVPANTLTRQGQGLLYIIKGAYIAVGSDLTLKVKFGGSTIVTIPTATLIGVSGASFTLSFTIDYVSSTSFRSTTTFIGSDSTSMTTNSLHWIKNTASTGFDFTTSNTILTTAATGATASLTYQETFLYLIGT